MIVGMLIVKLPAVLVLSKMVGTSVGAVLQVTPICVPSAELGFTRIVLEAVTAVELTIHVPVDAVVAHEKTPTEAPEQATSDGLADVPVAAHFVFVSNRLTVNVAFGLVPSVEEPIPVEVGTRQCEHVPFVASVVNPKKAAPKPSLTQREAKFVPLHPQFPPPVPVSSHQWIMSLTPPTLTNPREGVSAVKNKEAFPLVPSGSEIFAPLVVIVPVLVASPKFKT